MSRMKALLGDTPYESHYPVTPGFKERGGTSERAAEAMQGRAGTLRDRVLEALKTRAMTADEIAEALNETVLAIRPRVSELRTMRLIVAAGETRKNASGRPAQVWRAV